MASDGHAASAHGTDFAVRYGSGAEACLGGHIRLSLQEPVHGALRALLFDLI